MGIQMTVILQCEFKYSADETIKKMSKEQRDEIRAKVFSLKDLQEYDSSKTYYSTGIYGKFLVTETEFEYLNNLGIEIEIKNFKNSYIPREEGNGPKYHFHLPNIALIMFDEVMLLEDACTNDLQDKLDDNWRMIAICPPNGTRRPDYILDRCKK